MSIRLGKYNTLEVIETREFGMLLNGFEKGKILLPTRYIPDGCKPGDVLDVFLYLDQEERIIATTLTPYVQVDEFAILEVVWKNEYGAFLNWGLMKDLFVPFKEQKELMEIGNRYLIYAYIDKQTGRIVASSKIEKFFSTGIPPYQSGDEVRVLISDRSEIGYRAIVNNKYKAMVYDGQIFQSVNVGDKITAYVDRVRPDGRIDLLMTKPGSGGIDDLSVVLMDYINENGGFIPLNDKSDPELIYSVLGASKKAFKKAVGVLLRLGLIKIEEDGLRKV